MFDRWNPFKTENKDTLAPDIETINSGKEGKQAYYKYVVAVLLRKVGLAKGMIDRPVIYTEPKPETTTAREIMLQRLKGKIK